jgi:prepilin-type N-terminal cleavage/methylation domain-containing protein
MKNNVQQSGFTVVELLITLFVASAFLVAGFQLYNAIIKDGGNTRSESRVSNTAYDYLRRYSTNATTPCTASTPLSASPVTITGVAGAAVTITYNNPQQTVKYATYVKP